MMEKFIIGLVLLSLFKINHGSSNDYGFVQPDETIKTVVGKPIEVFCTLITPSNFTSKDLYFDLKPIDKQTGQYFDIKAIQKEEHVINETTIKIRIANPTYMAIHFDCFFRTKQYARGVNRVSAYVGSKPKDVVNFKCRSYDNNGLDCTFVSPYNGAAINYTLNVSIHEKPGAPYVWKGPCNVQGVGNQTFKFKLTRDPRNGDGPYRAGYEIYTFYVNGNNEYGDTMNTIIINQFDMVIPSKPNNLIANNITSNSAVLSWNVGLNLSNILLKDLMYKIWIKTIYDNDWQVLGPFNSPHCNTERECRSMSHHLTDLKFAYTDYDFRVMLKLRRSEDIEEMWSNFTKLIVRSAQRIPDKSPDVDIGAFSADEHNYYLYWKELANWEKNGDNLVYLIKQLENNTFKTYSNKTFIKIKKDDKKGTKQSMNFQIYSKNSMGESKKYSEIRIPGNKITPPDFIKKMKYTSKNNAVSYTYNISWVKPKDVVNIINYTVFWCIAEHDTYRECRKSLSFSHTTETTFLIETNDSLNVAVSANTENGSSGMEWAHCTALPDHDISKLDSSALKVDLFNSTIIQFTFSMDCQAKNVVTKFELEYCRIVITNDTCDNNFTTNCIDNTMQNFEIPASNNTFNSSELAAYKTYKSRIRMHYGEKATAWTCFNEVTTLETTPTVPENLTYSNVTNSKVFLKWDPPKEPNGPIVKYVIYYNSKHGNQNLKYNKEQFESKELPLTYELGGNETLRLQSYTDYEVYVTACTNAKCSAKSNAVKFQTSYGNPGQITQPDHTVGTNIVSWREPSEPGGPLSYYELSITFEYKGHIKRELISRIYGTVCNFTDEYQEFLKLPYDRAIYQVRAVNMLEPRFITTTSDHPEINSQSENENSEKDLPRSICMGDGIKKCDKPSICYMGEYSPNMSLFYKYEIYGGQVFLQLFLIIITFAFVYATLHVVRNYQKQGIVIVMPPGLEPIKEDKGKQHDPGILRDDAHITLPLTTSEQENDPLVNDKWSSGGIESASTSSGESNSNSEYNDHSIGYDQNTEEDSIQSSSDHLHSQDKKMPFIQMDGNGTIAQPSSPSEAHCMYNSHNNHEIARLKSQPTVEPPSTFDGYVPHLMVAKDAIARQNVQSSGYTQWKDININPQIQQSRQPQTDAVKVKITPAISGYVTQKQLTKYGIEKSLEMI